MKKLNFFTGGHKIHNQDWQHIQNALIEATSSLSLGLGSDQSPSSPFILTGIVLSGTPTSRTWTEGWLFWNGELYFVPAQVSAINGVTHDMQISETYLAGNPVTYLDATPRNVHAIRTLIPFNGAAEFGVNQMSTTNRIENRFAEKLASAETLDLLNEVGWTSTGVNITDGQTSEDESIQYRVIGNKVELRGKLRKSSGSYGNIFELPNACQPSFTVVKSLAIGINNGAGTANGRIRFDTSTTVVVNISSDGGTANTDLICLDGITYQI